MLSEDIILGVIGGCFLALLVWNVLLTVRCAKLNARWNKIVGDTGVPRLEQILPAVHERLQGLEARVEQLAQELPKLDGKLREMKGHVGVVRYNAFAETGSDLSFSVAIVDSRSTGVVFTGIHSRDHNYMYAKPLQEGQSSYALTPEEKEAVDRALNRK